MKNKKYKNGNSAAGKTDDEVRKYKGMAAKRPVAN